MPRWDWLPGRSPAARLARARRLAGDGRIGEAVAIWRRLAEQGIPRAQTNLGACYANGEGVAADPVAARHWLELAAAAGDVVGQRNLASLRLAQDAEAASIWYRRAAEQGDAVSQDQLSRLLLATAPQEARHWAERAAGQGMAAAAARLGMMCHDAVGGPRDPGEAVRWWRVAAGAGDADSAAMLGAALHLGQGIPADQTEAMTWLLVAAARHSTLGRPFFDAVAEKLSPDQREAAEQSAADRRNSAGAANGRSGSPDKLAST